MPMPTTRFLPLHLDLAHIYRYEGDDATSKDPVALPSQPPASDLAHPATAPGYGEEPEFDHDPTSFDADTAIAEASAVGANGDHQDQKDTGYLPETGIQMKDDG